LDAFSELLSSFSNGGKLLVCGNGGSAADSIHIVGELMKGFEKPRPISSQLFDKMAQLYGKSIANSFKDKLQVGLPTISLVDEPGLNTAFANDSCPDFVFANQVLALGKPKDCLLGISTSGNSANVLAAIRVARAKGLFTILLSGQKGGTIRLESDIAILVPETETFKIQELHLPVYHALCLALEEEIF
jgi:D-sedoheptulose 7-phosphate isomerase